MVAGRLLGDEQARADLPVCQADLYELEYLELARRQLGGRAPVRAVRSGRNVADADPAHALAKPIGGGRGPESGEDLEGPAHRGLVAVRECLRLLVGTADLFPGRRRRAPVPCHVQRKRLRMSRRSGERACAPQPEGDLSSHPAVALHSEQVMKVAHEGRDGVGPTAQPGGLRLTDGDVVGRVGVTRVDDGSGLTEGGKGIGRTTAHLDATTDGQRHGARHITLPPKRM